MPPAWPMKRRPAIPKAWTVCGRFCMQLQGVTGLMREDAPAATRADLLRAHDPALVDMVLITLTEEAAREHFVRVDADTAMSAGSAEAALAGSGRCDRRGRCGDGGP